MDMLFKHTTIVMMAAMIGKFSGFLREIILAGKYGAGPVSDAFIVAHGMPTILLMGIAGALATSYIPAYTRLAANSPDKAKRLTCQLAILLGLLGLGLTVLFVLFSKPLVRLFAIGFSGDTFDLTVSLARITMWTLVPILLINLLGAYLQIHGSFFLPGSFSMIVNLFVIIAIVLSSAAHAAVMAWGMCAGFFVAAGAVALQSRRFDFRYRPVLQWDGEIRRILQLCLPVFFSTTVLQISKIIDRSFASALTVGSVSAMNYASKLQEFIVAVFVNSLGVVIFPELSRLDSVQSRSALKSYAAESIRLMSFIMMPIMAGAMILARPIVATLFMRGAFDETAAAMTSESLCFYAVGFTAIGYNMVLTRVFYALQDTKTPAVNSVISVLMNITLNFILVGPMAHKGLALATSLSGIATTLLLLASLQKKIGPMGLQSSQGELLKILLSTAAMALEVGTLHRWIQLYIPPQSFLAHAAALLICAGTGAAVYFFTAMFLKVGQARALLRFFSSKIALSRGK